MTPVVVAETEQTGTRVFLHLMLGAVRGGCERDCEMVVRHLTDVTHRVLVLGPSGPMVEAWAEAGATVDVLGQTAAQAMRQAVRDYAARHKPAAVVVWHGLPHLPQIIAGLEASGARIGVHGGNPAHTMPWWVDWRYVLLGVANPVRRLPTYICCSQYVADSFDRSRYLRKFPRDVVFNGVPLPPTDLRQQRSFGKGDRFVVGMHARLDRIKDHATVLRAFAELQRSCPLAELELAGSGDMETHLRSMTADLGIEDAVRFLGSVTDVYGAMSSWDLFAYATTAAEGLGNAPAEALMLGLPSVMTDVGPIREVCGPGDTALLVPPYDPEAMAEALACLVGNPSLRNRLSQVSRRWAWEQFHPVKFAHRYGELLLPPETNPTRSEG